MLHCIHDPPCNVTNRAQLPSIPEYALVRARLFMVRQTYLYGVCDLARVGLHGQTRTQTRSSCSSLVANAPTVPDPFCQARGEGYGKSSEAVLERLRRAEPPSTSKARWRRLSFSSGMHGQDPEADRQIASGSPCFRVSLVWGLFCQAVSERRIFFLHRFLCSIWNPVSSPRPAVLQSRRAQELSRLAVAPTFPHAPPLPGHTLTALSTTAHSMRSG